MKYGFAFAALVALASCGSDYQPEVPKAAVEPAASKDAAGPSETLIVAGGCFWCTEADFEKVPGVTEAVSGYVGGRTANPTYEQVSAGGTGHYEAVRISYDPKRVSYGELIDYYFRTVDPLDAEGQFCDKGESYRTAIFPADAAQAKIAEKEKSEAAKALSAEIATKVIPASTFYPAEGYHQDYYKKNKLKYNFYRSRCGRDARLAELWGKKA
jgi:peptide-methionine (S)-S-oxide reductase